MEKITKEDLFAPGVLEQIEQMTIALKDLYIKVQYAKKAIDDLKALSDKVLDNP